MTDEKAFEKFWEDRQAKGLDAANRCEYEETWQAAIAYMQEHVVYKRYVYLKDRAYLNNRGWVIEAVKYHHEPTTFENDLDMAIRKLEENSNEQNGG